MNFSVKSELTRIREQWTNTDLNGDDGLNLEEFLSFRHPETSESSLKKLVSSLMNNMDQNSDELLDLDEFIFLNNEQELNDEEKSFINERKEEFKIIDKNVDAKIDYNELRDYVNPRNIRTIKKIVKQIFEFVDANQNSNY